MAEEEKQDSKAQTKNSKINTEKRQGVIEQIFNSAVPNLNYSLLKKYFKISLYFNLASVLLAIVLAATLFVFISKGENFLVDEDLSVKKLKSIKNMPYSETIVANFIDDFMRTYYYVSPSTIDYTKEQLKYFYLPSRLAAAVEDYEKNVVLPVKERNLTFAIIATDAGYTFEPLNETTIRVKRTYKLWEAGSVTNGKINEQTLKYEFTVKRVQPNATNFNGLAIDSYKQQAVK